MFAWAAVATQPNKDAGFRAHNYKVIGKNLQVHPVCPLPQEAKVVRLLKLPFSLVIPSSSFQPLT